MIPKALLLLMLMAPLSSARQTVRVRVVNNAVLVPVRVNGKDLTFLLDTGSEYSVIDSGAASSLDLGYVADVEILKNYRTQTASADQTTRIEIGDPFFQNGKNGGQKQDFVTPGLLMGRFRLWGRVGFTAGGGFQIATTRFHTTNHNGIVTIRFPF
jgi:hypothetical protein